jgi:hypothetical protein
MVIISSGFPKLFLLYIYYMSLIFKILLLLENNLKNIKSPSAKGQRAGNVLAPQTGRLSQLLYE